MFQSAHLRLTDPISHAGTRHEIGAEERGAHELGPNELGATLVEFAMSAMVLFTFLVLGLDIITFGYSTLTTQYVLNRAARNAIATTTQGNPSSSYDGITRAGDIVQDINFVGQQFGLDLSNSQVTICPLDPGAVCPPNNAGEGKDFIKITLRRPYFFVFGAFKYEMDLYVVAKNEPY